MKKKKSKSSGKFLWLKDYLQLIIAIGVIISLSFGVYFYVENRYALAAELDQVKKRLDYKIMSDQLFQTQERIWQIIDRNEGKEPKDDTAKEELRSLKEKKEDLKKDLDKLEKK